MSQTEKLYTLLLSGEWVTTVQIMELVYGGSHLGLARVGARIFDIKKRPDVERIESRKSKEAETVWEYRMTLRKEVPTEFDFVKSWVA